MTDNLPIVRADAPILPSQAETDAQVISLWLHGRSKNTQRAYKSDVLEFLSLGGKNLSTTTLADIQAFADKIKGDGLAPASCNRKLAAVKSLFAFAHRIGYLPFDVSGPVRLPGLRDTLNQRILEESEVTRMIVLENHPRNHAILFLLYAAGLRVSELSGLKWRDLTTRDDGGQVSVFGKGDKTRAILLPISVWNVILSLKTTSAEDQPVFRSRKGGHLDPSQILRIVQKAARRAGIQKKVSCHWFRHAHASHSLDRGAPIHLVQATLGHSSVATTGKYLHARPNDSSSRYLPL